MADKGRQLSPEEQALWERVLRTVRPLQPVTPPPTLTAAPEPPRPAPPPAGRPKPPSRPGPRSATAPPAPPPPPPPAGNLDGSWDRRLARGAIAPERMIDLHGHSLASAYATLDIALERAVARGERVLLLVTGKPPRPGSHAPHARGAIRAAVSDWLGASRHASDIAAVRAAHPRHGGAGALYVILRRRTRY